MTYRQLRVQQELEAQGLPSVDEYGTTFAVIIEVASGDSRADVQRTRQAVARQSHNVSIVEVTSQSSMADALTTVTADFVFFLRAGDQLSSRALSRIAKEHRVDPALRLISFDSDIRSARSSASRPLFRPEWSPEMLLGANYLGRAFCIKTAVAGEHAAASLIGSSGIWRLLLSADLAPREVGRVAEVLLSERRRDVSAIPTDAAMLTEVLAARGEPADVTVADGVARLMFHRSEWPKVSIVVPTRHSRSNLSVLLPSLAKSDYPSFDLTIIDNGERSPENEAWYASTAVDLDHTIIWYDEAPFNYSRVNNYAVAQTNGAVVLLLNDDTEIVDPLWLREMIGMLLREGIGTVGVQHRRADGHIQHGGVIIGPGGFADNLFAGLEPGTDTLIGSTRWYRDSVAVTGACVAITRETWNQVGGLDERFQLTGSDVVLGLDQIIAGRRNVVIPFDTVRHLESVTRGSAIPREDFFASYWRYHPWLLNGDPYSSPSLSHNSAIPRIRARREPSPVRKSLEAIGRPFQKIEQNMSISEEASALMYTATVARQTVERVIADHAAIEGLREVKSINWFIPDIDMPFFGGLNTAFRMAEKLGKEHGVLNRFVVLSAPNEQYFRSALAAAFPGLADSEIVFYEGDDAQIAALPGADAAIATLWLTAIHVAKAPNVGRKFYLMQDFEPGFYPASTMFAMAEETYKLGLYGICNTESMHSIYTGLYGGKGMFFAPAVDRGIYNAENRREKGPDEPVTIFAYARDHFRNCWELVYAALAEIKRIHGDRVRIVAAGARYLPDTADFIDMGLLDYRATGAVYRETDIGITMQISRHPSYLPLELMASGVAMVAPDSEWFTWLFKDDKNSLLAMRTLDDVVAKLDLLVRDADLRKRIAVSGLATIDAHHNNWDAAFAGIYDYLTNPEG